MKYIIIQIFSFLIVTFFCFGCKSASQKEADNHIQKAEHFFKNKQYEKVIVEITKALELTNDGESTMSANNNFAGNWTFLRGQSYLALGKVEEAIADFSKSILNGNEYLNSYTLNSNPKPYAKNEFLRYKLAVYYKARGDIYAKLNRSELASEDFAIAERFETLPTSVKESTDKLLK